LKCKFCGTEQPHAASKRDHENRCPHRYIDLLPSPLPLNITELVVPIEKIFEEVDIVDEIEIESFHLTYLINNEGEENINVESLPLSQSQAFPIAGDVLASMNMIDAKFFNFYGEFTRRSFTRRSFT